MILATLELENYKQFAGGPHRIDIPQAGVVGVIGANGVGKTTLFEAIEWCLYNPREIVSDEVPPRTGGTPTRVRVTLEDPRDGLRYVVERTQKRSGTTAEVYREDQPEAPIVQGTRQVTEYVARQLVGLSHRAFVSTFFTRQKELSFFGNLKETERRREVGRLLGLETIRDAQKAIGDERNQARIDASTLRRQHEEESAGRDFPAECHVAEEAVVAARSALDTAETRVAVAGEALLTAQTALKERQALERQDANLRREEERIAGDDRTAAVRREAAERELAQLDAADQTRNSLAPLADAEPTHASAVQTHETERQRFERHRQLTADLARAERERGNAARGLERAVKGTSPTVSQIEGWTWQSADASDPITGADRLATVAEGLDVAGARRVHEAIVACVDTSNKLTHFGTLLKQLDAERAAILDTGDPVAALEEARKTRDKALQTAQASETEAKSTAATRQRLKGIIASLDNQRFEDNCPTCGRPFAEHEAAMVLSLLKNRVADLEAEEKRLAKLRTQAQARATTADQAAATATKRASQLDTLAGRIGQGTKMVTEAREEHSKAAQHYAEESTAQGLTGDPTPQLIDTSRSHAELLGRINGLAPALREFGEAASRAATEANATRQALDELGPVAYDATTHKAATEALKQAIDARARIAQIDQQLVRRPDLTAEREAAETELQRLATERETITQKRIAVGFNPNDLAKAEAAERTAGQEERAALDARTATQASLNDASGIRDRLVKESERVARLAERSDTRSREADDFDRMYREFTVFDQFVAGRITPLLADQTSELLREVTDGKYDRVDFDENYGLEIYDGINEKFPIEEFSGGERDVAALCARLALSRLVGGQSSHPPGFLVLDEVFGSLDQERRTQVLTTLGALAGTAEAFRQLFIISHVDDVRASPIFSEIWRLTETVEGISAIEVQGQAGGFEEQ